MTLPRDLVKENLPKKGFEELGGDHIFYHLILEGKKTAIFTKVSRGSKYKILGNDLVLAMARQCKLTTGDFRKLVECTLSHEEYLKKLNASGHIKYDAP